MVPAEVKDLHAGDGFLENIIALYSLLFARMVLLDSYSSLILVS